MIKLAIDTLGSDNGYIPSVNGAIRAINEVEDLSIILFGRKSEIDELLSSLSYDKERVLVIDSESEINNYDHPVKAIKEKKNSSLVKALEYMKENEDVLGIVNASSTGALLVGSSLILGRIGSVRPAMASYLPNDAGNLTIIADCGANPDPRPEQMLQFAYMGSALAKAYLKIDNPRVAILSNGIEEGKGSELVKESYKLLKESSLNFIGNVEGSDALSGRCDVIVSDGFTGNVFLKTVEGSAKMIIKEIMKSGKAKNDMNYIKIGKELIEHYDFTSLGGGILLGVNKAVVKGHGSANEDTWFNCVKICYELAKNDLVGKIKELL